MSSRVCVLNAGKSEPLLETRELFDQPRTLQTALITGCKNCVPAQMLSADHVFVPEWNAKLTCVPTETTGITHVGIRAHYVVPCGAGAENALLCRIIDAADDVFSRVLTLLPAGGATTIRAEVSKSVGDMLQIGSEALFCLPKEHIMLLRETHEG